VFTVWGSLSLLRNRRFRGTWKFVKVVISHDLRRKIAADMRLISLANFFPSRHQIYLTSQGKPTVLTRDNGFRYKYTIVFFKFISLTQKRPQTVLSQIVLIPLKWCLKKTKKKRGNLCGYDPAANPVPAEHDGGRPRSCCRSTPGTHQECSCPGIKRKRRGIPSAQTYSNNIIVSLNRC